MHPDVWGTHMLAIGVRAIELSTDASVIRLVSLSTQPVGFGYVENRVIILPHKGHDRNFE